MPKGRKSQEDHKVQFEMDEEHLIIIDAYAKKRKLPRSQVVRRAVKMLKIIDDAGGVIYVKEGDQFVKVMLV
ncbi:TPA: hypothetical protein DF272_03750 [Candidatus Falkowbacteria bacterium]|nr:hypothetical protein [Candidatus Falkowbacteria bacterium]